MLIPITITMEVVAVSEPAQVSMSRGLSKDYEGSHLLFLLLREGSNISLILKNSTLIKVHLDLSLGCICFNRRSYFHIDNYSILLLTFDYSEKHAIISV